MLTIQSFAYLDEAFTGCLSGDGLDDLIGSDTIRTSQFWLNEMKQLDYEHFLEYYSGLDDDEYEAALANQDWRSSGELTEAARDLLREALAVEFGITAKHLRHVTPADAPGGPRPIGDFIEKAIDNMLISPPSPTTTSDAMPARAIAFGQPQIVEGRGQWDNTRYFDVDDVD